MNLGELKASLTRFPPDLNDSEVIMVSGDWPTAKLLVFTGFIHVDHKLVLILGTEEAVRALKPEALET